MNKLQGKDLINVGIFTAIYFVVMMAIAMLGFIPIFLPLLIVLVPLIGGIVMMLYYSKVQKFGMVSLTGLICGILMLLTGMREITSSFFLASAMGSVSFHFAFRRRLL